MPDIAKEAIQRFEQLAVSGFDALIQQHAELDAEDIAITLGVAAQRLRSEFGDLVADTAWSAVIEWREQARGE